MMETCCIHHVEFGVKNGFDISRKLFLQYGFKPIATRISPKVKQWVLSSGCARFVVSEPIAQSRNHCTGNIVNDINDDILQNDPYYVPFSDPVSETSSDDHEQIIESVFNVAFDVDDVNTCVQKLTQSDGFVAQIIKPVSSVSDQYGTVLTAIVKSCVGNVVHTLVQRTDYTGIFLPGFQIVSNVDELFGCSEKVQGQERTEDKHDPKFTHFDHIAFAAFCGSADEILLWYKKAFGMKRFYINREEDEREGFVIDSDDIGLRLKAFEYWKYAEVGMTSEKANSVKFIIAEALENQGPNQVDTFLSSHGGPGIQHIALSSHNIVTTVSSLRNAGVQFVEPPYTYYTEIGKLQEMIDVGEDVAVLKEFGILVDAEADAGDVEAESDAGNRVIERKSKQRYLLQKFTQPLFSRDTFFLEIIERKGATGLGAGNITALWRAVQAYLNENGHDTKS